MKNIILLVVCLIGLASLYKPKTDKPTRIVTCEYKFEFDKAVCNN